MVDHDDVEAEPARLRERLVAGGAAIDRDEQRRALRGERPDRLRVRPVAFEQAIGDVDDGAKPAVAQVAPEHRRRRRTVDVVVAEDRDRFVARDGIRQPRRRHRHVGERIGIRHQRPHGRIEEACDPFRLDAAAGENARQQLGHVVVALCDRERAARRPLVEPVAPGAPAGRALDAEKGAPR